MAKSTKTQLEYAALRNVTEIVASTIGRVVFTGPDGRLVISPKNANRTLEGEQVAFIDAVNASDQPKMQLAVRAIERILYNNPELVVTERNYGPLDIYRAFSTVTEASSDYDLAMARKFIVDALPKAVAVGDKVLALLDEGRTPLYAQPESVVEELRIVFDSGIAELSALLDLNLRPAAKAAPKPAVASRGSQFYAGSDHVARVLLPMYLRALGVEGLGTVAEALEEMPPITVSTDMVPWAVVARQVSTAVRPIVVDTLPLFAFTNMLESVSGAQRLRGKQTVAMGGTVQRRQIVKPQQQVEVGTQRIDTAHLGAMREAARVLAYEIERLWNRPVTFSRAERAEGLGALNEALREFAQVSGYTIPQAEIPETTSTRTLYKIEPNQTRTYQIVDVLRKNVATALLEAVKDTLKDPPSPTTTASAEAWIKRLADSPDWRSMGAVIDFHNLLVYMQDVLNKSDASEFTADFVVLKSGVRSLKLAVESAYCLLRSLTDPAEWPVPTKTVRALPPLMQIACTPSQTRSEMLELLAADPATYQMTMEMARESNADALLERLATSFALVVNLVNSRTTSSKANGELRKAITAFGKAGVEVDARIRANRTRNLRSLTRRRHVRGPRG